MTLQRIRMTVRYDGTEFAGSQVQPDKRTVAGTLTAGLESLTGAAVKLLLAGRTDAGVHADGNVCAFDCGALPLPVERLPRVINAKLPTDLQVRDAAVAGPGFHPRYSAGQRIYAYRIWRGVDVPVDRMRYVAQHTGSWDSPKVKAALNLLQGCHDFHAFGRGVRPGGGRCHMNRAELLEQGAEAQFMLSADRFLWQMVRRLSASLCAVADGRMSVQQFAAAVAGQSEIKLAAAPACGLTLLEVQY
jgi:tRNA pseudouridine38-40 synthase